MYKRIPVTALAAALALAAPASASSAANHWSGAVEGSDHGTFTTTPLDDSHALTQDQAVGNARHLGRYTLEAAEVINFATLEVSHGTYTITSPTGALTGSYAGAAAGTSDPSVITYHVAGPSPKWLRALCWSYGLAYLRRRSEPCHRRAVRPRLRLDLHANRPDPATGSLPSRTPEGHGVPAPTESKPRGSP
jgi:hypothetical protein